MRKVCALCGIDMDSDVCAGDENGVIPQGICDECNSTILARKGISLQKFIDGIGIPIVLVDSDVNVYGMNEAAISLFHMRLSKVAREKTGVVFDCEFARMPEGCGKTVHCNGCVIRRTVMETYQTRESRVNVPARFMKSTSGIASITTVKAGDAVLLKIDNIAAK